MAADRPPRIVLSIGSLQVGGTESPGVCHGFLVPCGTDVLPPARAAGIPVRVDGRRGASPPASAGVRRAVPGFALVEALTPPATPPSTDRPGDEPERERPSHGEGSPNAVREAVAAGLPAATTSASGAPDRVTGVLVPPRDPPALAAAIDRFTADPGRRARRGPAGRCSAARLSSEDRAARHQAVNRMPPR